MTNIKDVAREAGVSVATVSRTLSGSTPVSEEVRERVLQAARKLGYRPNALARSLRGEGTKTLGLVIPNILNPFFTTVARAVENAAWDEGYSIMLGNTGEDVVKEARYLEDLLQRQVDGLIISPVRSDSGHLRTLAGEVPLILLDRTAEGVEAPVVRADGRRAVGELVEYLASLGHERLAVISGPVATVSGDERLSTFLEVAERRGLSVPPECVKVGDFQRESGARTMREILDLEELPTAVFVSNNRMAFGALREIRDRGLRIPDDLSFASFDDVGWFDLLDPPVTAIAQPVVELGTAAAGTLTKLLAGEPVESVIFDADLLVRGSCAAPPSRSARNRSRESA